MAALTVRRATSPADREALLDLPRRLYAGDPAWVSPLRVLERRRLSPSNPFWREAQIALFLAERGGEVVGTVSALRDRGYDAAKGERTVWFGYFESVDDPEVARALLDRVLEQARAWGATEVRGPRNVTRMEYVGISIDGFDRRPPMLQGQHRPTYAGMIEAAGFRKHHDHYAYEALLTDDHGRPRPIPPSLLDKASACDVEGLVVRPARWRSMHADLLAAHEVLNDAYRTVPDVTPMPRATWLALGRSYLAFTSKELLQLAFVGDEPVAFAACLPEINGAMAAARGRLLPAGWARFVVAFRRERTAGFKLIGVKPAYRGRGVHAALIRNVIEGLQRAGYTRLDASIIDERNAPMRAVVEHAGCTIWRTYRVYTRPL